MARFSGLLGIITILSLAYIFSTNRKAIRIKTVLWGIALQFIFAWIVVRYSFGQRALATAGTGVNKLLSYSFAGSEFVFGNLGKANSPMGFFFAFQVLPTIIFISAFFAVLYHFGIMQFIIFCCAGSIPAWGVMRCVRNILIIMPIGNRCHGSGADKSRIHSQCAWRRSMATPNMR